MKTKIVEDEKKQMAASSATPLSFGTCPCSDCQNAKEAARIIDPQYPEQLLYETFKLLYLYQRLLVLHKQILTFQTQPRLKLNQAVFAALLHIRTIAEIMPEGSYVDSDEEDRVFQVHQLISQKLACIDEKKLSIAFPKSAYHKISSMFHKVRSSVPIYVAKMKPGKEGIEVFRVIAWIKFFAKILIDCDVFSLPTFNLDVHPPTRITEIPRLEEDQTSSTFPILHQSLKFKQDHFLHLEWLETTLTTPLPMSSDSQFQDELDTLLEASSCFARPICEYLKELQLAEAEKTFVIRLTEHIIAQSFHFTSCSMPSADITPGQEYSKVCMNHFEQLSKIFRTQFPEGPSERPQGPISEPHGVTGGPPPSSPPSSLVSREGMNKYRNSSRRQIPTQREDKPQKTQKKPKAQKTQKPKAQKTQKKPKPPNKRSNQRKLIGVAGTSSSTATSRK